MIHPKLVQKLPIDLIARMILTRRTATPILFLLPSHQLPQARMAKTKKKTKHDISSSQL
jgi:hypothetical protein|eukprot:COSAG06_NODE_5798_length_3268_cov_1.731777_3_plen_59_part_00